MKGTLVSWYKFIVNQIVLVAFVFSTALPLGAFAQSSTPTPAPVMTADTSGGYVASERFMNDKQEEEKGYKQGVVEMITTVILSLVIAVAPLPKRTEVSKNDCKQNVYGPITVAIAKAAAIIYIIAEIVNHAQFKKTGEAIKEIQVENAADAGAAEKGTAKEKDKQLTSFNRLKGLYENEKRLLNQKLFAQGMMTTMFATALGVEVGGMISCAATCSTTYAAYMSTASTALSSIAGLNTAITTAACGKCPVCPDCPSCTAYVVKSSEKAVADGLFLAKVAARGASATLLGGKKIAKEIKDVNENLKGINVVNSVNATQSLASNEKMFSGLSDEQKEKLVSKEQDLLKKANESKEDIDKETTSGLANSCPYAQASMQAHTLYNKTVKANLQCCGTELENEKPSLLYDKLPVPPGLSYINRDLKEPKDTETKLKKFLEKMKKAFSSAKSAITGPAKTSFLSPAEASALATQSEFYVKLDQYLKDNKKSKNKLTMNDHLKFQKFVENFYSKENLKKFDPIISEARKNKDPYMQKLVTLLDAVLIADANAGVVGDVISSPILKVMMMTGVGAMMFKKTIQKFYDKWGQKAPINRSIMWGVLTALALTVTIKTKKMQNDIDDRAAHVEEEKQKFIAATDLKEEIKEKDKGPDIYDSSNPKFKDKNPKKEDEANISNSCYTEEGADPNCSCKSSNSCMSFPDQDISSLGLPAMYAANIKGANQMANQMGQGKFEGAMMSGAGTFGKDGLGGFDAIRRKNKELQNKLNTMRKAAKQEPIDFEGMTKDLANGIASLTNATLAKDLGGGSMGPLASTGPTDLDNKAKPSSSESTPYQGASASAAAPAAPATGSLLGDESLVAEELPMDDSLKPDDQAQALNNFEVDNNDIVKTDENLFKILSSRYLRAYPKLLKIEESKDPKKNTPAQAPK
jgi:hypothetical protein